MSHPCPRLSQDDTQPPSLSPLPTHYSHGRGRGRGFSDNQGKGLGPDGASASTSPRPVWGPPANRHRGSALFLSRAVSAPGTAYSAAPTARSLIPEPPPRPPARIPKLHLPLWISPGMKQITRLLHPISLSLPPASLPQKTEVLAVLNGHPPTTSQVERGSNSVGVRQGACVPRRGSRVALGTPPACRGATRSSRHGVSARQNHGRVSAVAEARARALPKGPSRGWGWSSEHVSWQRPAAAGKLR